MKDPRPQDLLQVEGLEDYLPVDAPTWVRSVLWRTSWVVVRRAGTPPHGHLVVVRGADHAQRYLLVAPRACVVDRVAPEDVAGVRAWPTRDVPALQALREVRAPLNQLGLPWGPIGSVGFELITGLAAVTPDDDLDLIVRASDVGHDTVAQLLSLQDDHFRNLLARVDCRVETAGGWLGLSELHPGARQVTATGAHI
jgi:phosphoribosyl-dephospho-CoA transferase